MMESELEGLFNILRNFQKNADPVKVLEIALNFRFSKKDIIKHEKEYYEKPD